MDRRDTVTIPLTPQVNGHAAVAVYTIMTVVDVPDPLLDILFLGIIILLPVLPVVVISIRADSQPPQKPADAELCMMLFNKSISL